MARTALRLRPKKLGVGLMITALAKLQVLNLARRSDSRPTTTFISMAVPD